MYSYIHLNLYNSLTLHNNPFFPSAPLCNSVAYELQLPPHCHSQVRVVCAPSCAALMKSIIKNRRNALLISGSRGTASPLPSLQDAVAVSLSFTFGGSLPPASHSLPLSLCQPLSPGAFFLMLRFGFSAFHLRPRAEPAGPNWRRRQRRRRSRVQLELACTTVRLRCCSLAFPQRFRLPRVFRAFHSRFSVCAASVCVCGANKNFK